MSTYFAPNHVLISGVPASGKTNTLLSLLLALPTVDSKGLTHVVDVYFMAIGTQPRDIFKRLADMIFDESEIPFEPDAIEAMVREYLIREKNIDLELESNLHPNNSVYESFTGKIMDKLDDNPIRGFSYLFIDGLSSLLWWHNEPDAKEMFRNNFMDGLQDLGYSTRMAL